MYDDALLDYIFSHPAPPPTETQLCRLNIRLYLTLFNASIYEHPKRNFEYLRYYRESLLKTIQEELDNKRVDFLIECLTISHDMGLALAEQFFRDSLPS
jgi:hypothetical protein